MAASMSQNGRWILDGKIRKGCRILERDITTLLMNIYSPFVLRSNGDDL